MSFSNPLQIECCPITLTEFNNNESIVYLQCNHIFNPESIIDWVSKNGNCPICRKDVSKDDLKYSVFKSFKPSAPLLETQGKSKFVICTICNFSKHRNNYKGLVKNFKCGKCRKKRSENTDDDISVVLAYSLLCY